MSKETVKTETGVVLPDDNVINVEWAREQLSRVDLFSASLLAYGRGEVMFMLQNNLPATAFEEAINELGYSVETANTYISYLQKRAVIEAIREKYYVALSLSAAEYIPDSIEDALAICDITVAKYGKLTADNIKKALESTGQSIKKMSDAAISVEKMKKKALNDWLLDEHAMSEDDIYQASQLHPEGLKEFTEKMSQAFFLLEDWKAFYDIIAPAIKSSDDSKALRFLSDLNDASGSIIEYLDAEQANQKLTALKDEFEAEVYPKLSFEKEVA
jgi:hypothetical protein